jgi:hypothetical protein
MTPVVADGPRLLIRSPAEIVPPTAGVLAGGVSKKTWRSAFGFGVTMAVAVLLARSGSGRLLAVIVAVRS